DSGLSCDTCATVDVNITHTTTYTLVAYNGPCTDTVISKITVEPAPNGIACCNDSISMGDTATIKAIGTGIQTYFWTPDSDIVCNTCPVTKVFPQFTTTYTVVMTDSDGCSKTDSVRIYVSACSTVWIPNAFTPNGDEKNNVFAPKGVCMIAYSMQIFDRWGDLLYTTNDSKPWDGRVRGGGSIVQEDTYIYLITATDGYLKQTKYLGRVTVIK
ncbi:MAG TPA: gliding motility-associated C-terminal domain-containing protein, partial [Bacteroidia bacterium]|nr:gliding motility-associated C-terminal domain-containing protein [Bacteroidia bacterium]